jgi:hypothetical protein
LSDLIRRNPALWRAANASENSLTLQRIVFVNSLPMVNRRWSASLAVVRRGPKGRDNAITAAYAPDCERKAATWAEF